MPVVNLRKHDRTTQGESKAIVLDRGLLARSAACGVAICVEKSAGVECVIGKKLVRTAMDVVGSGFRSVFDEPSAGMAILCRVGRGNDPHLLNAFFRWRTLVTLLMTNSITKCGAV